MCAKSIFIIDKEGNVFYKQITDNIESAFDLNDFDVKLNETISFKKKGDVHENWMGA